MSIQRRVVVTGAFSYSGRYMARRLLQRGDRVSTLTGRSREESPFGGRVESAPLSFDRVDELADSLMGADALINTYWVRFDRGDATHERAVVNTRRLIDAAKAAGVRRIVHVSITNPSRNSRLPYFRGKAELEGYVRDSGLSHAILRPTVLFGPEDVLVNNIAWMLRRLPLFGLPGLGRYPIQPVFVDDLASLAVEQTASDQDVVLDAVGPEIFTFAAFVRLVRRAIRSRTPVVPMPHLAVLLASKLLSCILKDVVLTRDEIEGLSAGLLVSRERPTCMTRFSEWVRDHGGMLGLRYASELARHWRDPALSVEERGEGRSVAL